MKRTSLRTNTKVKAGHFISLSATRATNFADKANKAGYDVAVRPCFAKAGWEVDVSDWKRRR